jgi:hypothetical protein
MGHLTANSYLQHLTTLGMSLLVAISRKCIDNTRAFHLMERSFFCEGGTNKKMHFKSHVLASPIQLPTTAMA